jgi:HPt (histidine-containing phosphotransfer) domain-containing protein
LTFSAAIMLGTAAARSAVVPDAAPGDAELDALPVLDATAFDEAREFLGDEADEVIGNLIESFRSGSPQMLLALRDANASAEPARLRSTAHTLKGLSGTVGARRVQALCEWLEAAARAGTVTDSTLAPDRLEIELGRADGALARADSSPSPQRVSI